jgi:hypothetical protein
VSCRPESLAPRSLAPLKPGTTSTARITRALACEVRFVAARVRLVSLLQHGYLHLACESAYESGLAGLPDHAQRSQLPPRLDMVSIAEPESGQGTVTLPLRWLARVADRSLRVLDAKLSFAAREGSTSVRLDGFFRLPAPPAGSVAVSGLAQFGAAAACAESLLEQLAEALSWADDTGQARRPGGPGAGLLPRPRPDS